MFSLNRSAAGFALLAVLAAGCSSVAHTGSGAAHPKTNSPAPATAPTKPATASKGAAVGTTTATSRSPHALALRSGDAASRPASSGPDAASGARADNAPGSAARQSDPAAQRR